MQELLYTSAPRGLKPGSRGFCTVLSTQSMVAPLAAALEGLSGYRPVFPIGHARVAENPVVYSHLKLQVAGKSWYVLSRIADYGLDYSQRTNKLAHHLVLEKSELPAAGPASLLRKSGIMRESWEGEPTIVPTKRMAEQPSAQSGVCQAWKELTGDAGWAGVLAESFLKDPNRPVILLFEPGQDLRPLIDESLSLLPAERRWDVTFSTYFTGSSQGITCLWRGILLGSKEATESLRFVNALRIDLTSTNIGRAEGGELVEAARKGLRPAVPPPLPQNQMAAPDQLERCVVPPEFADQRSAPQPSYDSAVMETNAATIANREHSQAPPRLTRSGFKFAAAESLTEADNRKVGTSRFRPFIIPLLLFLLLGGSVASIVAVIRLRNNAPAIIAEVPEQPASEARPHQPPRTQPRGSERPLTQPSAIERTPTERAATERVPAAPTAPERAATEPAPAAPTAPKRAAPQPSKTATADASAPASGQTNDIDKDDGPRLVQLSFPNVKAANEIPITEIEPSVSTQKFTLHWLAPQCDEFRSFKSTGNEKSLALVHKEIGEDKKVGTFAFSGSKLFFSWAFDANEPLRSKVAQKAQFCVLEIQDTAKPRCRFLFHACCEIKSKAAFKSGSIMLIEDQKSDLARLLSQTDKYKIPLTLKDVVIEFDNRQWEFNRVKDKPLPNRSECTQLATEFGQEYARIEFEVKDAVLRISVDESKFEEEKQKVVKDFKLAMNIECMKHGVKFEQQFPFSELRRGDEVRKQISDHFQAVWKPKNEDNDKNGWMNASDNTLKELEPRFDDAKKLARQIDEAPKHAKDIKNRSHLVSAVLTYQVSRNRGEVLDVDLLRIDADESGVSPDK